MLLLKFDTELTEKFYLIYPKPLCWSTLASMREWLGLQGRTGFFSPKEFDSCCSCSSEGGCKIYANCSSGELRELLTGWRSFRSSDESTIDV